MKCKLCLKEFETLELSHIIPEWMYNPIYDEKHKFVEINANNYQSLKAEQKGYREYLLCFSCEQKISKWEDKAKKDLDDILSLSNNFLKIEKISEKYLYIEGLNYEYFKKFTLSIFWRMSISTLSQFRNVNLGPYQNKLRELLDGNLIIGTLQYPILLQQLKIREQNTKALIAGVQKGRVQTYTLQSFVAYGYMFDMVVSDRVINIPEILTLNQNGTAMIEVTEFLDLSLHDNLLKRFTDNDVLNFYNRSQNQQNGVH